MNEEELPRSEEEEECRISLFDYSVENHLKAVDSISDLCGEANTDIDKTDIDRLTSSVTFLRCVKSKLCVHINLYNRGQLYREEAMLKCLRSIATSGLGFLS